MQRARRRPRRTALVATLLALAATTAACTAAVSDGHGSLASSAGPSPERSGSAAPSQVPVSPAQFVDCTDRIEAVLSLPSERKATTRFGCATVSVPLDYGQPAGKTISIQLLRVHDQRDTHPIGSLLVNPGGPGASGVDLAGSLSIQLSTDLLRRFDVVGFDPRGVGLSNRIQCLTDAQKDTLNAASPDVLTTAGFEAAKRQADVLVTSCDKRYGKSIAQYNTVQTAKDMDLIRRALGDSQLNYLGFSYGTELGAQYAHLFPGTIRTMVLDGAVNPLTADVTAFAGQLQGFESAFDQFAAWCAKQSSCAPLGNARQAVYRIIDIARRDPIPSATQGETRKATTSLVYTGVLSALYSQSRWPDLAAALRSALDGNSAGLLTLADSYNERIDGHYSNILDANATISCNDEKAGQPTDAQIKATAKVWAKKYPMFGLWSAASLFGCQQWQPDRTVLALPTARTAAETILVVGNIHDPATPYQGAKDLARTLGKARLLTWNGEGHTSYLQGSSCIDGYVNRYLLTKALPPQGTTCPR